MAYIPTEWQTGDIITAAKLNKAEQGIAAAEAYIVPVTYDDQTETMALDASYNELVAHKGHIIIGQDDGIESYGYLSNYYLTDVAEQESGYFAIFARYNKNIQAIEPIIFRASSASDNMVDQVHQSN